MKKAQAEYWILAIVAVIALLGLVFAMGRSATGGVTGAAHATFPGQNPGAGLSLNKPTSTLAQALQIAQNCCQNKGHVAKDWQIFGTLKKVHGKCREAVAKLPRTVSAILGFVQQNCPELVPGCTSNAQCDDGNSCNGQETCKPDTLTCQPGTPLNCDDGSECTQDSCAQQGGCLHDSLPAGISCANGQGTCVNGECQVCEEGAPCDTGQPGVCAFGSTQCFGGESECFQFNLPSPEVCDKTDNDCDGSIDEELGTTTCGIGACQVIVENCVGGVSQVCTPGQPITETCDEIDNDCDGLVDEDGVCTVCGNGILDPGEQCDDGQVQTFASCGTGACTSFVPDTCVNCQHVSCVPGPPSAETCNNFDDDCDGTTDEGIPTQPTGNQCVVLACQGGQFAPQNVQLGTPCTVPNGGGICSSGQCIVQQCAPGFGNCNFSLNDGCELNLLFDDDNCGGCNNDCNPFQQCCSGVCIGGNC